ALVARIGDGAPLDVQRLPRSAYWQAALEQLIEHLRREASAPLTKALDAIGGMPAEQREACAEQLLLGHYLQVDSGEALFFWAALSLYF
ncbi:formate dehydrogenase accessory protein FdhE, partial [Rhizobium sp. SIMBA_035]